MTLFDIYGFALLLSLIVATFSLKDAWPFSCYPMFSTERKLSQIVVYRIAFISSNDKEEWWQAPFQHLQRDFGKRFYKDWTKQNSSPFLRLPLIALLLNTTHSKKQVKFILVYKRTVSDSKKILIQDEEVLRINVNEFQNGTIK